MSEKYEQLSTDGKQRVVYGYDNPLETFYLQVFEVKDERPSDGSETAGSDAQTGELEESDDSSWEREIGLIAWVGTLTGEIPTVDDLVSAAVPYVAIPAATIEKLKADQQSAPGPTAFQRAIRM